MAKRLTEQFLRSIKPTGKRYTVADDGLQAEVHPTGRVSLYYKYRQGGKQTKEKLGEYSSDAFTLRMARDRVRELQAKLGADDLVRQSGLTLKQYIEGEFRRWCEQSRSSHRETTARLRAHLVPPRCQGCDASR